MLRRARACHRQVEIFEREWPEGAAVTLENVQRAAELGLDLDWFAYNLFTPAARDAYDEATAPAWAAYDKATAPARAAYNKACATAFFEAFELKEVG